jgi:hypothetical protein
MCTLHDVMENSPKLQIHYKKALSILEQGTSILVSLLGPSTFTTKFVVSTPEPVFSNVYGVLEPIPRNDFRQPM